MDKLAIFQSMLEKDPENYEAWFLLGEEYRQLNRLGDALFSYSKALGKSDPKLREMVIEGLKAYLEAEDVQLKESPEHELKTASATTSSLEETPQAATSSPETISPVSPDPKPVRPATTDSKATQKGNLFNRREEDNKGKEEETTLKMRVLEGGKKDNVVAIDNYQRERITFKDVGGLSQLKKTIEMKIIKPFQSPGLFSRFSKKSGGGILLYGPPGCGKTFIAGATAGEIGANFYPVYISEILDRYFGASERNLHNIFETARANKPSVLFFDEIDTLGYSRSKSSTDLMRPLVDTLLTEMQSINNNTDKLLVIGATNMPWDVDSAFKRPGRFDKMVFVPPPDKEARKAIFQLKLNNRPIEGHIDYDYLAEHTVHYSGADIENVVEMAAENVITSIIDTGVERGITMDDLLKIIRVTKASTLEWLSIVKNYVKYGNQSGLYSDVADYIKKHS